MKKNKLSYFVLTGPAVIMFSFVMIIPFILGVYYSFTDWSAIVGKKLNFVGLKNYTDLFQDQGFIYSFGLTLKYAAISMLLVNAVALLLAYLVTRETKIKNFLRTGFFVPNLIGGIVLGYLWQFIFNNILVYFGEVLHIDILKKSLLIHPKYSILALVIVGTWQYAGYIMMIYVAAIQNIPSEILEAADIDGAKGITKLWRIVLPMILPAITINLFLTLINAFKQFDINFALNNGGPGMMFHGTPVMGSELLALNIYNTAFSFSNMALAQAKSIIFFIVLMIIALCQVYFTKRKEVEA